VCAPALGGGEIRSEFSLSKLFYSSRMSESLAQREHETAIRHIDKLQTLEALVATWTQCGAKSEADVQYLKDLLVRARKERVYLSHSRAAV
jgi:hypothetical protein